MLFKVQVIPSSKLHPFACGKITIYFGIISRRCQFLSSQHFAQHPLRSSVSIHVANVYISPVWLLMSSLSKLQDSALADFAQWLECPPKGWRVRGSILVKGTKGTWVARSIPGPRALVRACVGGNWSMCLSNRCFSLPPSLPFYQWKEYPQVKINKEKTLNNSFKPPKKEDILH